MGAIGGRVGPGHSLAGCFHADDQQLAGRGDADARLADLAQGGEQPRCALAQLVLLLAGQAQLQPGEVLRGRRLEVLATIIAFQRRPALLAGATALGAGLPIDIITQGIAPVPRQVLHLIGSLLWGGVGHGQQPAVYAAEGL